MKLPFDEPGFAPGGFFFMTVNEEQWLSDCKIPLHIHGKPRIEQTRAQIATEMTFCLKKLVHSKKKLFTSKKSYAKKILF